MRPYLLRGFYEWVVDNALTPYIIADATQSGVTVPQHAVVEGKIVLNISPTATQGLEISNDAVIFGARFNGVHEDVWIPVDAVSAIYAKENGKGITFSEYDGETQPPPDDGGDPSKPDRPALRLVKS